VAIGQSVAKIRRFLILQGGGRRHLGFLDFQISNGWNAQESQTASQGQILWRSVKLLPRYGDFFSIFGRPFVKRFALYAIGPLSVCPALSVTLVYRGQTVGRIKMKLGMRVGLGPGHIALHGDVPLAQKGHSSPIFGPYLFWSNDSMDQDATW